MKIWQLVLLLVVVTVVVGALAVVPAAEEERQSSEGAQERRRPSREERIQSYLDVLKEKLAPTGEQWKDLEPKLSSMIDARLEVQSMYFARIRRLRGLSRRTRFAEAMEEEKETPQGQLYELLKDESAKDDAIKAKLDAVRAASDEQRQKDRERSRELRRQINDLEDELEELINIRQEAILVLHGVIS
jgi:vacuolar-type H+-ATPase subunit I/STV1